MADLFDNPMGLCGFEFVEFASPQAGVLEPLFEKLGFSLVARHRSKDVVLYRQGDIHFIVNRQSRSLAGYFAAEHGPGPCAMAFRVRDAHTGSQRIAGSADSALRCHQLHATKAAELRIDGRRGNEADSGALLPSHL